MRTAKFLLCALVFAYFPLVGMAHAIGDKSKEINKVKRDTTFIYAEATTKSLEESCQNALAILEMKVGEWVRVQHPNEAIDVCIVKAKEHTERVETRRGDFYRVFVFVNKGEVLPIADKSEVAVLTVNHPAQHTMRPVSPGMLIDDTGGNSGSDDDNQISMTEEEKRMLLVKDFYGIEPYIKSLQSRGELIAHGKYATMPADEDCHLFVYDPQGNIVAFLRKCGLAQYNLKTHVEDSVTNYKKCGAIWFQLK